MQVKSCKTALPQAELLINIVDSRQHPMMKSGSTRAKAIPCIPHEPKRGPLMMRTKLSYAAAALAVAITAAMAIPAIGAATATTETVDLETITSIRQEGFRNSKVMDTLSE